MRHGVLLFLCLAQLALCKPLAAEGGFNFTLLPHDQTHGHHTHQQASVSTLHARKADQPFHVSLSGHVVHLEEVVRVYYDLTAFTPASLLITLHEEGQGREVADCTAFLQPNAEYASFSLRECVGTILDVSGGFEWHVSGNRREGGGAETRIQRLVRWVRGPVPWPFQNDNEPWPPSLPNLVGNLQENYQSFSGQGAAYWHTGLDIMARLVGDGTYAQELHTPVAGRVVNIVRYSGSDLYWSIMVLDEQGFVWQFHHLDPRTFTVEVGSLVDQGDVLGNVCFWPSMWNGVRYHHVHLNVVRPDPRWGETIPNPYVDGWQYFNPFHFFDNGGWLGGGGMPASDGEMFFLPNSGNTAFASSNDPLPPTLAGKVDVIMSWESEFGDTNSIGGHPYPNGLFTVGYSVEPIVPSGARPWATNGTATTASKASFSLGSFLKGGLKAPQAGTIAPQVLLAASKIPNEWDACQPDLRVDDNDMMLRRVFRQAFSYQGRQLSSVFTYQTRKLWYTLTNTHRGQPDADNGFWDTAELLPEEEGGGRRFEDGEYLITGFACDVFDNCASVSHPVIISN